MAATGSSRAPIVISDDDDDESAVLQVATTVDATRSQRRPAEGSATIQRPEWLPDGFVVRVERLPEGGTEILSYVCPVGSVFKSREEVEKYRDSGALQRAIAGEATLRDMNTLQGKYNWFIAYHPAHVLEIRAGGENFNKMFKFYAHLRKKVRIASKEDFMRYVRHSKIPEHTNEECDTSSDDNIIAQLEFRIPELPPGWVKEIAFRKRATGIRKDTFYTNPVNKRIYRSLGAAKKSLETGTDEDSYKPKFSVTDLYFFDNCTDMHPYLADRLRIEGTKKPKRKDAGRNLHSKKQETSIGFDEPEGNGNKTKNEKKRDKDATTTTTSKPSRPRGRPRKS